MNRIEKTLDSALHAVARAEDKERKARESRDRQRTHLSEGFVGAARISGDGASFLEKSALNERRLADTLLGLHVEPDAYGTVRDRPIDIILHTAVARMVAHADTITELREYLHEDEDDEDPEDLW